MEPMLRAHPVALVLAAASLGSAQARADALGRCEKAGLSGRFFVATADGYSWTLMVDGHCRYQSLRFSGDPANDLGQPTKGAGKLARIDGQDVFILQSAAGEFADVLTVVRPGPRLYLVPTNQHLRFCVEWAQGREPRKGPVGRFLLRAGDENTAVGAGEAPAICRQKPGGGT